MPRFLSVSSAPGLRALDSPPGERATLHRDPPFAGSPSASLDPFCPGEAIWAWPFGQSWALPSRSGLRLPSGPEPSRVPFPSAAKLMSTPRHTGHTGANPIFAQPPFPRNPALIASSPPQPRKIGGRGRRGLTRTYLLPAQKRGQDARRGSMDRP